ncbi:hypothetical protein NW759_011381 [Fusarium solani]|nr:hypothetical protein NW759_011381 [Fusarium solani]
MALRAITTLTLALAAVVSPASATPIEQKLLGGESTEWQSFGLKHYPGYSMRIREQSSSLCDTESKQYTGWLEAKGKHLFFWYVESLSDPQNDPLNLWMTGGPGCSGLIGMMMELGPCLINEDGSGTRRNPFSWTANASMIFIDQPAGTGFSYVDEGVNMPSDSFTAAKDVHIFLQIFYSAFPHLSSLPFHISGESYGGHYVPTVAAEIVRYNKLDPGLRSGLEIPLKSVMIGDGFVSPLDTTYGYYDTLCTTKPGVDTPIFNETRCTQIREALPRCVSLHESCYQNPDPILCHAADSFCSGQIRALFDSETGEGGRDPFDITRTCEVDQLCYTGVLRIQDYVNEPSIRDVLGVPKQVGNFTVLNEEIQDLFGQGNDLYVNTAREVLFLLENEVDVLIYNGNLDLACNTAGNLRWTERVAWAGQADFVSQDMRVWHAPKDGKTIKAGTMKEVAVKAKSQSKKPSRFSFVTVDMAGHMVPLDQPEISLHLINTWLIGGEL